VEAARFPPRFARGCRKIARKRMTLSRTYRDRLRALLSDAERRTFARLNSPQKIQDFLDRIPANYETHGPTHMSPRRMLKERLAHCTEGALFAIASLAYHGREGFLIDLRALPADQDHVVAVFRDNGLWGAISKTNHPILRWRDPIYRSPRELVMSYAHEYFLRGGRKSLLNYSRPFRVTRYTPRRWVIAEDNLDWLIAALDDSPHLPLAPAAALRRRRFATAIERRAVETNVEWPRPKRARRARRSRKRRS
jgi:hypothetical protein